MSVHTEAIKAMADRFSLPFQPLHEEEMFDTLEEVTAAERQRGELLLRAADEALFPFECQAKLRPLPARRPARAVRHEQRGAVPAPAQENSSGIFSGALASMLSGVEERPPGRRAQDHEPGPAGPAGAHGGNLIAGKGRYIAHVIESAAINRKSEEVNR